MEAISTWLAIMVLFASAVGVGSSVKAASRKTRVGNRLLLTAISILCAAQLAGHSGNAYLVAIGLAAVIAVAGGLVLGRGWPDRKANGPA